jgi:uncharacterized membrane protein (UPF0182 family)
VQRELLQRYHVTDAGAFYGQQDFWSVPDDPTRGKAQLQPPYYLTLQMPGQDETSFSLTSTFIPAGRSRNVLTGFLAVDADAGSTGGKPRPGYGKLRMLQLPREVVIPGPGQVQNTFNSDPTVSQVLRLLPSVLRGNLLTLPLAGGLLYVQPVYVQSSGNTSFPLLRKVLVTFGEKIGFADDLDTALDQVFGTSTGGKGGGTGGGTGSGTGAGDGTKNPPSGSDTEAAALGRLKSALTDAATALKESDTALKAGDFAAYGAAQKRLTAAVQEATDAQAAVAAAGAVTPKPSASASPPAPGSTPSPSAGG